MPETCTSRSTPAARAASAIGVGAYPVDRLVALAAALESDARGIDHGLAALDGVSHRLRHPEIGAHQGDLADIARGLDLFSELDAPAGDAHEIALGRQRPHDSLAQKPLPPKTVTCLIVSMARCL